MADARVSEASAKPHSWRRKRQGGDQQKSRLLVTADTLKEKQVKSKEELDKKRSRMDARHDYIVATLAENLQLAVPDVEEGLLEGDQIYTMDKFFQADGPNCLLFFYEGQREAVRLAASDETAEGVQPPVRSPVHKSKPRIYLTDGLHEAFPGMCAFFLRLTSKPLTNHTVGTDTYFGMLEENGGGMLGAMRHLLSSVFVPALQSQSNWGLADANEAQQLRGNFLIKLESFVSALAGAEASVAEVVKLPPCDGLDLSALGTPSDYLRASTNPDTVDKLEKCLTSWCREIEQILTKSDQMRKEADNVGPRAELEYWKKRMAKFNALVTHVKSRDSKVLLSVLQIAKSKLLKTWRALDARITEGANESKDNVKFLQTMEKYCDPLYRGDPVSMLEGVPGLINAIRMIHSYSRYYNTAERMTALFVKVTNQMIAACKNYITNHGFHSVWEQEMNVVIPRLDACMHLNQEYQKCVQRVKDKIAQQPDEKPLVFSEMYVFGKFNTFCQRLTKIKDVFAIVKSYKILSESHIEGIEVYATRFSVFTSTLKKKPYDVLDHRKSDFDVDYHDFKANIADLEAHLQMFFSQCFERIPGTRRALELLSRFELLALPCLDVEEKYQLILLNYIRDIEATSRLYNKLKNEPPIEGSMPPVAGKIQWARQLLQRIEEPMIVFKEYPKILQVAEAKKVVKQYNRLAQVLLEYELLYHQAWLKQMNVVAEGLSATVFVRHPKTKELFVNFDDSVILVLREVEVMQKLGLDVPPSALSLQSRQTTFKRNSNQLKVMLATNNRIQRKIPLILRTLFTPHLTAVDAVLEPGVTTITWTSLTFNSYVEKCKQTFDELELLVNRIKGAVKNRIDACLTEIGECQLCDLPESEPVVIDEFLARTRVTCEKRSIFLESRSRLIEEAAHDIIDLLLVPLSEEDEELLNEYDGGAFGLKASKPGSMVELRAATGHRSRRESGASSELVVSRPSTQMLPPPPGVAAAERRRQVRESMRREADELLAHFEQLNVDALLKCIRQSLESLRKRTSTIVAHRYGGNDGGGNVGGDKTAVELHHPIFRTDLVLLIPDIAMRPSLDEVQQAVNKAAALIVAVGKGIHAWGQLDELVKQVKDESATSSRTRIWGLHGGDGVTSRHSIRHEAPVAASPARPTLRTYGKSVSENKELAKSVSMLSSAINSTKRDVLKVIDQYSSYHIIWKRNRDEAMKDFLESHPQVAEFQAQIIYYQNLEQQILDHPEVETVGAISLFSEPLKIALCAEAKAWRVALGEECNTKYRSLMEEVFALLDDWTKRLSRPINDLDDVRAAMGVLREIRENEIRVDTSMTPIEESYALLHRYQLPVLQEESERVDTLRYSWNRLLELVRQVQDHLIEIQADFKATLVENVAVFHEDLGSFYADYGTKGPMAPDVQPREASDRLVVYQNRFDSLWRRHDTYSGGEELFGLSVTEYPDLVRIRKELILLQKLYGLYNNVIESVDGYYEIAWNEVDIEKINAELLDFQNRCRKLPKGLKDWQAYEDLKKKVDDFNETCPLLEMMANKAMKPRHWTRIAELTGHEFDVEAEGFLLRNIMEAPLLVNKEDIEDVCIAAVKEQDIEAKLKMIETEWGVETLRFSNFKNRGELLLRGDDTTEIVSRMEDSLMILSSLMSNRYNAPFKAKIQQWVHKLSTTTEIIENWLVVQNLWIYLEAVFVGGDIAKQLPKEAKRFQNIDKSWVKIMTRAHETNNVVQCCVGDETLGQLLPHLLEQLEVCQKSLSGYLEAKRLLFPRFFFVSDPALLEILGQASDSHTIQAHLLGIFDNVKTATFHEKDYDRILAVNSRENVRMDLEKPVMAHGNVETWLDNLLKMVQKSLHGVVRSASVTINDQNFEVMSFLDTFIAQVGLLGLQMVWTRDAEAALTKARSDKKIMSTTDQAFLDLLNQLIGKTTEDLGSVERTKYETLITIHVHQRDIFHDLVKMHIRSPTDFEWLKQSRFYFNTDIDKCVIAITDVNFTYQNEYLGCTERLVITPLTDRCYITLAQALGLSMGGAPAGPAGTGKTETVKDMGKALGKYVVVFNCSDQMDYRGLGRIYKGLAQSGSWGCFDEFNRIELPVLSVAAQQIAVVLSCKKDRKSQFIFTDGDAVSMNPEFGIFLTMNPGYAGRQELPENLKMQFRTVAMMVPDRHIIIRVKLASVGFIENIVLSRKFFTLYKLCEEQLTKQVHYDFGLRNILSVLRTLGAVKRESAGEAEGDIVMRVLRDMNLSKLVDEDEPLFLSLISDLFPGVSMEKAGYPDLEAAIAEEVNKAGLINHPPWTLKLIQLFETQRVRHGMMVLGPSGAGKTCCIHILMKALTDIGRPHREMRMNPKAITASQMFGRLDVSTNDWTDGIFSTLWRKTLRTKKGEHVWLVLDGPVDTLWIENLNSVLDDNKTLTLANGDRIPMSPNCKIIFEPHNIDNASPATVSRNGMVYMSSSALDWRPILQGWLKTRSPVEVEVFTSLFESTFQDIFNYFSHSLNPKMDLLQCNYIAQALGLLQGLIPKREDGTEVVRRHLSRLFSFSIMWSLGAALELEDRVKLEVALRRKEELDLPEIDRDCRDTIFEFVVNDAGTWQHWKDRVPAYEYPKDRVPEFSSILVPNVDNVRMDFLIHAMAKQQKGVLLMGEQGTAKTVILKSYCSKYNQEEHLTKALNFSSATTPNLFQRAIESYVEKRVGSTYGPPAGRRMTVFIDDVNMPLINEWGDQVTNEIVRQLMEMRGFYSLDKPGDFITIADIQFVAAMIHPGGGRNDIPQRLKRRFVVFNCTLPSNASIDKIFGVIASGYFCKERGFAPDVVELASKLVVSTRRLWQATKIKMLSTPAKFHYIFNLRDLSRIWEGMLKVDSNVASTTSVLMALWKHEAARVIADRFISPEDRDWFDAATSRTIGDDLDDASRALLPEEPYFVDFLREAPEPTGDEPDDADLDAPKIYEMIPPFDELRERLETSMLQYNEMIRGAGMDLVFFKDAMVNLIKISRIIRTDRGNALLVGVGGSGKQSLTRLASFIAGYKTFQITLTRAYNVNNLIEDLKHLYNVAGTKGQGVTFLFTDQEIKDENFLEYMNNVLSSGEVSNLFGRDELDEIFTELTPVMKKEFPRRPPTPDNLYSYFISRARQNLHVVLCFSPVGEKFRNRALKFPGLISGCTMDWFFRWPKDALVAVARHFVADFEIKCESRVKQEVVDLMGVIQDGVAETCVDYFQRYRRSTHVTPKSYLSFLTGYKMIYESKRLEIGGLADRMNKGLEKLVEASQSVEQLSKELAVKEKDLAVASEEADKVLKEVAVKAREAEAVKAQVQKVKDKAQALVDNIDAERAVAQKMLDAARPALEEAEAALKTIQPSHIANVRNLKRPPHLIQRIMDCVLLLFQRRIDVVVVDPERPNCIKPSWSEALKMMSRADFLSSLLHFNKDSITDETVELLAGYFEQEDYVLSAAKRVCADVAGLLSWTKAMAAFYSINKEVLPLKANLMHQEARLALAEKDLATAQAELDEKQREKDEVQAQYDAAIQKKEMLTEDAETCRRKMNAATALISGLSGERERWTQQSKDFQEQIGRLVGDVLLCTGFLSYAGPFNQEYRTTLLNNWMHELKTRRVPYSSDINVTKMLANSTTVGEWNLQGLPNDELSIQNGIIVTKAARFPLLIDPQGQGKFWIRNKEASNELLVTSQNHKYFRNHLEDALSLGRPLLMEDVGEELDPVLDNVLERNFIKSGSTFKVKVGDKEVDVMKGFRFYITTKLANPLYTPEISAKTSIIDFTVTMKGLGDQLLGMVILKEKAELESERTKLMEDVQENKKKMKELEDSLLFRLTSTKGSLVDDESLIEMLRTTKATAEDVQRKLQVANEKETEINAAREEFRPVATRGSILYFLIVEMSMVNVMYQTSLAQFLELFELSMTRSSKSPVTTKRISNIVQYLTMTVFRYSCRGLYENHKFLFTLLLALKIDLENGRVKHQEFQSLIKGGAALDLNAVDPKPAKWILDSTWLNLVELSKLNQFSEILNQISRNEKMWRSWFESNRPEESSIPDGYEMALDTFRRLILIRSWCPDRTTAQARKYISEALGNEYAEGVILDLKELWEESSVRKPMICFLSQGSDPTNQIEALAKRVGLDCRAVSMGQGQEVHARRLLQQFMSTGGWAMLQNCHLGLNFLDELLNTVTTTETVHEDFRLWMTTEVHKDFPINLLQISIKFTNEPPQGIKAGLKRTFTGITQDVLDVTNMPQWKPMLYAVAFLHTTVQERRKFGPLGWNIPYEYNNADLNSSMQFVQNHIDDMDLKKGVSWSTVRYMLGEVHYGGRVTDDMDKRLLNTFCKVWFGEHMFGTNFRFYKGYSIPHCSNVAQYMDYIEQLPLIDSPEVFGLHTNADITYQTSLAKDVLDTIVSIQPKDSAAGGGETRESVVQRLADDMLDKLPQDFVPHEVKARLQAMGSLSPMNIFLRQEIDRMQRVITCVRNTLLDLKLAIDGTIIMSESLRDALDRMYDARIPTKWRKISWDSSSLGFWFTELLERNAQFRSWCFDGRPTVFWMTGFFNPQGFLTAMRQEVTRAHKGWALDSVVLHNEVLKQYKDDVTVAPEEGVYIYGLFLDGAGWDRRNCRLTEAPNKVLFTPMPIVHMYAINSTSGKDPKLYCCPVYKKPHRTDLTYITDCTLKTPQGVHPDHWTLRGVALLCDVK